MLKTNFLRFAIIFSIATFFSFTSGQPFTEKLTGDVLKYTNQYRKSKGMNALEMRDDLNAIARKHSEDMASGRTSLGHSGYNQRVAKVKRTVKPCDGFVAENVAYGASNGKEAFDIWKKSSGHRKNMLGDYKYIGIGTARSKKGAIYYTQIFVR